MNDLHQLRKMRGKFAKFRSSLPKINFEARRAGSAPHHEAAPAAHAPPQGQPTGLSHAASISMFSTDQCLFGRQLVFLPVLSLMLPFLTHSFSKIRLPQAQFREIQNCTNRSNFPNFFVNIYETFSTILQTSRDVKQSHVKITPFNIFVEKIAGLLQM